MDNDGKLRVLLSVRRLKTDIADMGGASEALPTLRPVTFHYKPELDKNGHPAVRRRDRGGGEGEPRSGDP